MEKEEKFGYLDGICENSLQIRPILKPQNQVASYNKELIVISSTKEALPQGIERPTSTYLDPPDIDRR